MPAGACCQSQATVIWHSCVYHGPKISDVQCLWQHDSFEATLLTASTTAYWIQAGCFGNDWPSSQYVAGECQLTSVRPMLMSDIWHRRIGGNWTHRKWKGNGAPTADAPNLQRRVYDVAAAATRCNQTQAHCAREAVIKCNAWRHHCVRRVLVLDRWAARHQGNSLSCHSCRTALYEHGTTDMRMKLTDLTS